MNHSVPTLNNWALKPTGVEGAFILIGEIMDHPTLADGTISQTGIVKDVLLDQMVAMTKTGNVFELGLPNAAWVARLEDEEVSNLPVALLREMLDNIH